MTVWRITGYEIGPDGNGACYFRTKKAAELAWHEWCLSHECGSGPEKIVIKKVADLVWYLNDAMGYGVS